MSITAERAQKVLDLVSPGKYTVAPYDDSIEVLYFLIEDLLERIEGLESQHE